MNLNKPKQISSFILWAMHKHGDAPTNLWLQKILYYVQAWYLALNDGAPLFDEDFEAWVHGPVLRSIFNEYKSNGWHPIMENIEEKPVVSPEIENHIINVLSEYGDCTAWQLERMTHNEDPWKNARNGLAPDESSNNIITKEAMTVFYGKNEKENS